VRRADQRRAAVFALYQHDLTGKPLIEALASDASSGREASLFSQALAHAAADRAQELDEVIDRHSHGWSVQRIQPLERSIMRVALIEILHPDAAPSEEPIPPEGAIEEAVETAKMFCGADAPAFVNGVLAAILRELREVRENAGEK
jgi:N utilization substance protein B